MSQRSNAYLQQLAVLNGYLEQNAEGLVRPTQMGIDIAWKMFEANPSPFIENKINLNDTTDMICVIYTVIDAMIEAGHVEDWE